MNYLNPQGWWEAAKGIKDVPYNTWNYMSGSTGNVCEKGVAYQQELGAVSRTLLREISNLRGSNFIRVAGLSGAVAVAMAAYGSHVFNKEHINEDRKIAFRNANFQHYAHTLALLAVPLTRKPYLVGTLLTVGMILFCGGAYSYALTDSPVCRRLPPYGGVTLILAWMSMII